MGACGVAVMQGGVRGCQGRLRTRCEVQRGWDGAEKAVAASQTNERPGSLRTEVPRDAAEGFRAIEHGVTQIPYRAALHL